MRYTHLRAEDLVGKVSITLVLDDIVLGAEWKRCDIFRTILSNDKNIMLSVTP